MTPTGPPPATCDVLGLGCAAVDDVLYLPAFPVPDGKLPVTRRERRCGGQCVTALRAAARLGARCAYAGRLGDDGDSRFVEATLRDEGVDLTHAARSPGVRPIHATVLVDEAGQTRTVLYDLNGTAGAPEDSPPEDVLRAARVLLVDHYGTEGMLRAAQVASAAGVPVVADFEHAGGPQFAELLALVDHLILSRPFAASLTGQTDPADAVRVLWNDRRSLVVVTCGAEAGWYATEAREPRRYPAFPVNARDTTGCGDVFHGAYAAALAWGRPVEERLRLAAAAAGAWAEFGELPTLARVEGVARTGP